MLHAPDPPGCGRTRGVASNGHLQLFDGDFMPSLREAPLQVSSVAVVGADDTIDLSRQPTRHAPTAHSPDVPSEPTLDHLSRPPRGRPRPHTLLAR